MAKESGYFHESERKNIVISHEDFAQEQLVDDHAEISEVEDFLLTCEDWEVSLIVKRSSNDIDTRTANFIFTTCLQKFKSKLDSVTLFDVITRFYNFNAAMFYEKLGHSYRTMLLNDLKLRININISNDIQLDDKVQKSFTDLLKKFK